MANQFESFIQLELPKRPYLETDSPEESIIIRRGPGPRQLSGLPLAEGQTIAIIEGKLTAVPYKGLDEPLVDGIKHSQEVAALTWTITHGKANRNVVVSLFDTDYSEIISDTLVVSDNDIVITFTEAQAGYANVVFL